MLRAQLITAQNFFQQENTGLQALHKDWQAFYASWPPNKRSQMTFEFASQHLSLLDSHDIFIIQHLALWELLPRDETSRNMDCVLGLDQSIFAYICLAHYLETTPETAYLLQKDKRIQHPKSLHEEAWKTIESAVMYRNEQEWMSF